MRENRKTKRLWKNKIRKKIKKKNREVLRKKSTKRFKFLRKN